MTRRNRLVYVGTAIGLMIIWWWAYVLPMDEAREEALECMDKQGNLDAICKNDQGGK